MDKEIEQEVLSEGCFQYLWTTYSGGTIDDNLFNDLIKEITRLVDKATQLQRAKDLKDEISFLELIEHLSKPFIDGNVQCQDMTGFKVNKVVSIRLLRFKEELKRLEKDG